MAGQIEFLEPDPPPEHRDDAAPRPHRAPGGAHTLRTAALIAVAVLVAAAFVVRIVTGGSDSAGGPPTTTVPASPSVSITLDPTTGEVVGPGFNVYCDAIPVDVPITIPNRTAGPPGARITQRFAAPSPTASSTEQSSVCTPTPVQCPRAGDGQSACTTTTDLPPSFRQAVRTAFPGAVLSRARTDVTRETNLIWYRGASLRSGSTSITIVLEQPGSDPGPQGTVDNGSQVITRAVVRTTHNYVIVVVVTPSGSKQHLDATQKLAHDARLSAVS